MAVFQHGKLEDGLDQKEGAKPGTDKRRDKMGLELLCEKLAALFQIMVLSLFLETLSDAESREPILKCRFVLVCS